ncbi:hypothetical protein E2C01_019603 [Portunus trituberculatus]|uniref:Uncharacterized protein n=1 Tax=Portunus trituberculatus TaxID=210409 RepID=A0A5B7DYR7_PORTR|nr:hypothetical protein [Portunus trituberculatus]
MHDVLLTCTNLLPSLRLNAERVRYTTPLFHTNANARSRGVVRSRKEQDGAKENSGEGGEESRGEEESIGEGGRSGKQAREREEGEHGDDLIGNVKRSWMGRVLAWTSNVRVPRTIVTTTTHPPARSAAASVAASGRPARRQRRSGNEWTMCSRKGGKEGAKQ